MHTRTPHFLLFSEAAIHSRAGRHGKTLSGQWRFTLEAVDGSGRFAVEDEEEETEENRLELLAVVRALESLDQPSRVTLVSSNRYVNHGFRYGLEQWRESDWTWENFGEMAPIRNRDLWQRIDWAMKFHRVDCRTWRFDPPQDATDSHPRAPKATKRSRSKKRPVAKRAESNQESNSKTLLGWCTGLFH